MFCQLNYFNNDGCPCCGNQDLNMYTQPNSSNIEEFPDVLKECKKGVPFCHKCGYVFRPQELNLQTFMSVLEQISNPMEQGRLLIGYFHLDELLKQN